jgi:hypothetical protein
VTFVGDEVLINKPSYLYPAFWSTRASHNSHA